MNFSRSTYTSKHSTHKHTHTHTPGSRCMHIIQIHTCTGTGSLCYSIILWGSRNLTNDMNSTTIQTYEQKTKTKHQANTNEMHAYKHKWLQCFSASVAQCLKHLVFSILNKVKPKYINVFKCTKYERNQQQWWTKCWYISWHDAVRKSSAVCI